MQKSLKSSSLRHTKPLPSSRKPITSSQPKKIQKKSQFSTTISKHQKTPPTTKSPHKLPKFHSRQTHSTSSPIPTHFSSFSTSLHSKRASMSTSTTTTTPTTPQIYTKAVILPPKGEHKRTVFFLHGLGDEGASFVDVFEMLNLNNTKVILPNAPKIPITCNNGWVMPGWYDLASLGDDREFGKNEDVKGINASADLLIKGIEHEASLVGYDNIVIGGFSQGSAMSQLTAVRLPNPIAGVIALSGYALLTAEKDEVKKIVAKNTPLFIYHGKSDEIVKIDYARKSKEFWDNQGLTDITYHEEDRLGHSLSQKEIVMVKQFLNKIKFE